jgi:hypothetical protein
MFLVFDFCLGQRGLKGNRPVNRFFGSINEVLFDEGGEGADDIGLKGGRLGLGFVFPVGEHAKALELRGLLCDPEFGEFVALRA